MYATVQNVTRHTGQWATWVNRNTTGDPRIALRELEGVQMKWWTGQRGCTLLEVMVVVVILGILAALVVPKIISRPDEARAIAAKQDIASLMQALKVYRLDNS